MNVFVFVLFYGTRYAGVTFKWLPGSHFQQYYINQAKLLELTLSS